MKAARLYGERDIRIDDVEAPTPWYPVIKDFEPDIETFYRDWLNLQVPERA